MVTIVCILMVSGLAAACSPQIGPTDIAGAGSPAGPQATPGQKPAPPPVPPGQPQDTSGASDAIQHLGLYTYPNIYAGGEIKPDGSIMIYLGPGDDTAFLNALHALLASPTVKALGSEPAISITRVPHSEADFDAASRAFNAAIPQLTAKGFVPGIPTQTASPARWMWHSRLPRKG